MWIGNTARKQGLDVHERLFPRKASVGSFCKYGLLAEEAPAYMKYPFVLSGYRSGGTYRQLLREGLTSWHTETINAHTVLWNAVLSTCALAWVLTWAPATSLPAFLSLWLSALVHAPFSVGYHLFLPISAEASNLWRRLDVCAIFVASALLTHALSAFVLPRGAAEALTVTAAGVAALACARTWRLQAGTNLSNCKGAHACFVAAGVTLYAVPLAVQGARGMAAGLSSVGYGSWCAIGALLSLLASAVIYAASFPERLRPGGRDLLLNSHQIMHMGIMLAHAFEWAFLVYFAQHPAAGLVSSAAVTLAPDPLVVAAPLLA